MNRRPVVFAPFRAGCPVELLSPPRGAHQLLLASSSPGINVHHPEISVRGPLGEASQDVSQPHFWSDRQLYHRSHHLHPAPRGTPWQRAQGLERLHSPLTAGTIGSCSLQSKAGAECGLVMSRIRALDKYVCLLHQASDIFKRKYPVGSLETPWCCLLDV